MRMLQNYFVLNRFIVEAKPILEDSKIKEIFSQEKSKLIIVTSKNDEVYYLELCVIPGNSYINIRRNYSRAKKNTVNFFDKALGEKILSLEIASDDRIIKLRCSTSEIYFTIRGKFTNVFFFDADHQFYAFKSVEEQTIASIKKELTRKIFLDRWNQITFLPVDQENYLDEVRKKYPILGSEITKEVKARLRTDGNNDFSALLNDVLNEIRTSKPCAFIDEREPEVHLGFETFKSFPFTDKKVFDSLMEAVNYFTFKKILS